MGSSPREQAFICEDAARNNQGGPVVILHDSEGEETSVYSFLGEDGEVYIFALALNNSSETPDAHRYRGTFKLKEVVRA